MSLNKLMHPRNKYRRPPDFKTLAAKYPEFNKHVRKDRFGKVSLDFKNPKSLQALSTTLLMEDFELNVEIPVDPLIPTIPLYMNYLLWIEDLVAANPTSDIIRGVDIGCAGSCAYPLLAAKRFQWHMLATEADTDNAFLASNNVRKNRLSDRITVRAVEKGTMLQGVLEQDVTYDFSMCNTLRYYTGSGDKCEVMTVLTALVLDSLLLKERVRVYTVKVADQTTADTLVATLQQAGVTRTQTHQFCQGRSVRWGVAWTLGFGELAPAAQSHKPNIPFTQTVEGELSDTVEQLLRLMDELKVTHSILKRSEELCSMEITAMKNTWSIAKKRLEHTETSSDKEAKAALGVGEGNEKSSENVKSEEQTKVDEDVKKSPVSEKTAESQGENASETSENGGGQKMDCKVGSKRGSVEDLCDGIDELPDIKKRKMTNGSGEVNIGPQRGPVLTASLVVRKTGRGSVVEMSWLRGPGGRNLAQQLLQHLTSNIVKEASV